MAQQARALQTRRTILLAAAAVFDEYGYGAATIAEILARAGVTKGALYFHFTTKEELARAVMAAQMELPPVPPQSTRMQEVVDHGLLLAHQLVHDPLTRASIGLAMDQWGEDLDRSEPFRSWIVLLRNLLEAAQLRGELLPQVDVAESAEFLAGAFTGVQELSHVLCERADLTHRYLVMMRHVLPALALPSVLVTLELNGDRALRLLAVATVGDCEQPVGGRRGPMRRRPVGSRRRAP